MRNIDYRAVSWRLRTQGPPPFALRLYPGLTPLIWRILSSRAVLSKLVAKTRQFEPALLGVIAKIERRFTRELQNDLYLRTVIGKLVAAVMREMLFRSRPPATKIKAEIFTAATTYTDWELDAIRTLSKKHRKKKRR